MFHTSALTGSEAVGGHIAHMRRAAWHRSGRHCVRRQRTQHTHYDTTVARGRHSGGAGAPHLALFFEPPPSFDHARLGLLLPHVACRGHGAPDRRHPAASPVEIVPISTDAQTPVIFFFQISGGRSAKL
jgi:hypothetical protein